jgi:hypothetical protein
MSRGPAWTPERVARLRVLWGTELHVDEIARQMGTSRGALYLRASMLKLTRPEGMSKRGRKPKPGGTARKRDKTGQRRFTGVVSEGPRVVLEPHHPAFREGTTFFPGQVTPASRMVRLLKSGKNSRKLGEIVEKGRWKGQRIFSLTLEERETCPRSCLEWASCYGNNMNWSSRISDDGTLTRRLWGELASLNAEYPAGFVVRLHVLGDFYSTEYVQFWRQALDDFPGLNIFGFTARLDDPIGRALRVLVEEEGERFRLRFSGAGTPDHASEVVDSADQATGILCPAESDPDRCCATCALCFQTTRTISFVRH